MRFLGQTATKVGSVVVTEAMGNAVDQAKAEAAVADASAMAQPPATLPHVQQVLVDEAVDTALNVTARMFGLPKETVTKIVQAGLPIMAQMAESNPALLKAMYAQSVQALPAPLQIYYEKIAADPSAQQQLVGEFQTLYGPMTDALNREVAGEVGVSHEQAGRVLASTMPAVTRAISKATPEANEANFSQWLGELINQRAGVTPMSVGATQLGPQTLVWATFSGVDGASQALSGLQAAGQAHLLNVAHTAVIEKDAAGTVTASKSKNLSGWQGLGASPFMGGLLPTLLPGISPLSGAAGASVGAGLATQIRDAGFQVNALRNAAEQMPPDSSALIALVTFKGADALTSFLRPRAVTVGRADLPPAIRQLLGPKT